MASGVEQGAELLTGGKRPEGFEKGFFFEPTVFIGTNDMRIAQEEIFGPVFTVVPYSGKDDDAVRLANDSIYGLGGGVESQSTARAFNVARRIRAGTVLAQGVGGSGGADVGPGGGQGPGWGESDGRHRSGRRLRWLQAERHRPRVGNSRPGRVHRDQGDPLELRVREHCDAGGLSSGVPRPEVPTDPGIP